MLRSGWLLLFAFLASGFIIPPPLMAAEPKVTDRAEFFSNSAVEQATRKIQDIRRRFKVEVVVETFPSIPENMKSQYRPDEKNKFFRRWAETCAADQGVKGIYVLICKKPGHLQMEPDQLTRKKAFTLDERDALVKNMLKRMNQKQYDAALSEMVASIETTLQTNLGQRTGGAAPTRRIPNEAPAGGAGQSSGILGWICLAVVVLLVVWLIKALIGAFRGGGNLRGVGEEVNGDRTGLVLDLGDGQERVEIPIGLAIPGGGDREAIVGVGAPEGRLEIANVKRANGALAIPEHIELDVPHARAVGHAHVPALPWNIADLEVDVLDRAAGIGVAGHYQQLRCAGLTALLAEGVPGYLVELCPVLKKCDEVEFGRLRGHRVLAHCAFAAGEGASRADDALEPVAVRPGFADVGLAPHARLGECRLCPERLVLVTPEERRDRNPILCGQIGLHRGSFAGG